MAELEERRSDRRSSMTGLIAEGPALADKVAVALGKPMSLVAVFELAIV